MKFPEKKKWKQLYKIARLTTIKLSDRQIKYKLIGKFFPIKESSRCVMRLISDRLTNRMIQIITVSCSTIRKLGLSNQVNTVDDLVAAASSTECDRKRSRWKFNILNNKFRKYKAPTSTNQTIKTIQTTTSIKIQWAIKINNLIS